VPCTKEGLSLVKEINELPDIIMEGIFTHFSKADEYDKSFAHTQLERFDSFTAACGENGIEFEYRHCANSAAILELKETDTGLVRAGIIIYGLRPSDEVDIKRFGLVPALSLKSSVIYIKRVPKDTPVSYGGTFVTERETVIATIPAGYADGYPRSLSNKGYVLIRGKRAKVLGRVCMDQMMVDVTAIPGVKAGDLATLMGRDGTDFLSAEELAAWGETISYEVLLSGTGRVRRLWTNP
jgi:alanine racemase